MGIRKNSPPSSSMDLLIGYLADGVFRELHKNVEVMYDNVVKGVYEELKEGKSKVETWKLYTATIVKKWNTEFHSSPGLMLEFAAAFVWGTVLDAQRQLDAEKKAEKESGA